MKKIRIAFYVSRYKDEEIQTPPSLQYLAGFLISKNLLKEENLLFADSIDEIITFKPHILCIGSVSQTFFDAKNVALRIKDLFPECFTIIGGYHISALPNELSHEFNVGVIGEGEVTLYELVNLYMQSLHKNYNELKQIKGICFKNNNKLIITEKRDLLKNIDIQPRPYRRVKSNQTNMYIFSARGCPYQCTFCASQSFWEKYRAHSAQYVVEEIEDVYNKFGITNIYFVDDLFIAPKSRLIQLHQLLKEKQLLGKLSFEGFVRINIIDEEVIRILKEMKFKEIRFGLETASPRLMKIIKHQPPKMKKIFEVIELCKKYDLKLCGSLMFGIPGETIEDIEITVKFLRDNINDFYINGFYLMQPVPGTQLWDDMKAKNILTDTNFDVASMEIALYKKDFNWNNALYLNEENISLNDFKIIINKIKDEFFFNKEIHLNNSVLQNINPTSKILVFGAGTLAELLYQDCKDFNLTICASSVSENNQFQNLPIFPIKNINLNSYHHIFITPQKDAKLIYTSYFTHKDLTASIYIPVYKYLNNIKTITWKNIIDEKIY